jgi:cytochrome c oxidase assembly protein subunit 15
VPKTQNRAVMIWLLTFAALAAFLVVFGGFVRLTRSGLSIVEWNPVGGTLPPLSQGAWQEEFAKYQRTPEFIKINFSMTLDEYKEIFIIEWIHRLLARLEGLVFAIPFFIFLLRGRIPWREAGLYVAMGFLFIMQAFAGWYMVASGLVERPSVSQYLLTTHLLLALTLIGLALWAALGHRYGFPADGKRARWSRAAQLTAAAWILLLVQIVYGGFTAGLKAGHISATWPLMFGQLIPEGLFSQFEPAALNLVAAPATVMFIHRWLAFAVLGMALWIYTATQKSTVPKDAQRGALAMLVLVTAQIVLGILVVLLHVDIVVALFHQTMAIVLFATSIYLIHRLRSADRALAGVAS